MQSWKVRKKIEDTTKVELDDEKSPVRWTDQIRTAVDIPLDQSVEKEAIRKAWQWLMNHC